MYSITGSDDIYPKQVDAIFSPPGESMMPGTKRIRRGPSEDRRDLHCDGGPGKNTLLRRLSVPGPEYEMILDADELEYKV